MIRSNRFAIEPLILYRYLFYELITTLYALFLALHFDVTKMSLTLRIGNQEAVSFAHRSRKKCMWISDIFVIDWFYLCGVNF